MKRNLTIIVFLLFILTITTASWGLDAIVEKKTFVLDEFTLVSGKKYQGQNIDDWSGYRSSFHLAAAQTACGGI